MSTLESSAPVSQTTETREPTGIRGLIRRFGLWRCARGHHAWGDHTETRVAPGITTIAIACERCGETVRESYAHYSLGEFTSASEAASVCSDILRDCARVVPTDGRRDT